MRFPERIAHLYCPSTHSSVCPWWWPHCYRIHIQHPPQWLSSTFTGQAQPEINRWIYSVHVCATFGLRTMTFLSRWAESVKLGRDKTSILDEEEKKTGGSGNHFLLDVYIQSRCWFWDGVQTQPGVMGIHTPLPDTPGTELVTDEDMRIDSFWPTQKGFAFYRNCIFVQWLISL